MLLPPGAPDPCRAVAPRGERPRYVVVRSGDERKHGVLSEGDPLRRCKVCGGGLNLDCLGSRLVSCPHCGVEERGPAVDDTVEAQRRFREDGGADPRQTERVDSDSIPAPAPQILGGGRSAAQIAAAVAAAAEGAAEREEVDRLSAPLRQLPGVVENLQFGGRVSSDVVTAARSAIRAFVPNARKHRADCPLGPDCPFWDTPNAAVLSVAALRRSSLRFGGAYNPGLLSMAAGALQGRPVNRRAVRTTLRHFGALMHSCRPCALSEAELDAAERDPEASFESLDVVGDRKAKITALFNAVHLPPRVQIVAHELAVAWSERGGRGVKDGTFAAAALAEAQRRVGLGAVGVPTLAEAGGVRAATVERYVAEVRAAEAAAAAAAAEA